MRRSVLFALALAACHGADAPATPQAPFRIAVAGGFDDPWALAFLPGGAMLVTEKSGKLLLRAADGSVRAVAGVPPVDYDGQGGLLDVALSPDFAHDRFVYLTYAEPGRGGSSLALARARLSDDESRLEGLQAIWRQEPKGHGGQFGAIVVFSPDGRTLFLSSGERQRFTPAQDPDQAMGKILRLTPDGKPAPGNPQAGRTGATTVDLIDPPENTGAAKGAQSRRVAIPAPNLTPAETWSTGHRNPYGLAFDAVGRLWETEMGPKGGDELNLIEPGKNYGWPNVSNGSNYDGSDIPDHHPGDGYEPPKLWWNPSVSPSSLVIYSGSLFPAWKGSGLIGALSGRALIRVTLDGATAKKAERWNLGRRIRFVAQGPDGAVWLLEDGDSGGRLLRLTPRS
ncbi:MAG: PQQ-dependent sugar dehydrogenase [Sphingomonadaceae bacterium]|nr:PQQ-dependent sugar dehydrogenase [Sphingomonadaceae bacterium]